MLTSTALVLSLAGCVLGTALKSSTPEMQDTFAMLANQASNMGDRALKIEETALKIEETALKMEDTALKVEDKAGIDLESFLVTDKYGVVTDMFGNSVTKPQHIPITEKYSLPITNPSPVYSTVGSGGNGVSVNLPNNPDCNMTIDGYTWECNNCTIVQDVIDSSHCAELCLEKPWCVGWTWELSDSAASFCYLFEELVNQHPCSDCSNCTSGMFNQFTGVCSTSNPDHIVGIESASSELQCVELCSVTPDCNYYSWSEAELFHHLCFMFKECEETDTCESFQSGQLECFNQDVPDQCQEYWKLYDKTRNVNHYGAPVYCDRLSAGNTSPDWNGDGWYRMVKYAGEKIPEYSPGHEHCGTHASGWLAGTHPSIIGSTVSATVCYDFGNECTWKNKIKITNCGDYFVYYLPEYPNACSLRFCAV